MTTIKMLCDEDIDVALAAALKKRGYDVAHVSELKRKGCSDEEQLRYAIEQGRCLLSFNVKDFVLLHYDFLRQGAAHHGIIVVTNFRLGREESPLLQRRRGLGKIQAHPDYSYAILNHSNQVTA